MKVLTVKQPWAWLIIHGGKDIENRTWRTPYRGPLVIQASSRPQPRMREFCDQVANRFGVTLPAEFQYGGAIGVVDVVDCVRSDSSRWFEGPVGWVLANPRPLPFIPIAGRLYLFDAPPDVASAVIRTGIADTDAYTANRR
jgi:hypothetical protein